MMDFLLEKEKDIYNPWSITKYLDTGEYGTYWADTSGNALISTLIRQSPGKNQVGDGRFVKWWSHLYRTG